MMRWVWVCFFLWCQGVVIAARDPFLFQGQQSRSVAPLRLKPLHWHSVPVHYLLPKELDWLKSNFKGCLNLQSQACIFNYDTRRRVLVVKMTAASFQELQQLLKRIDRPQRQVLIRAKIVSIDRDYLTRLGLTYSALTQPAHSSADSFSIPIFRLATQVLVNARISALQHQGHAMVMADPVLFTLDQQSASIESGTEIPYQQSTKSGATSVAFKKAVLRLKITPQIVAKNKILLSIEVNQDGVGHMLVNGEPAIKTQRLVTHVMLKNNDTILLGGIIHNVNSVSVAGVPVLQHLPLVGGLFRTKHRLYQHKVLLLLVTPQILGR